MLITKCRIIFVQIHCKNIYKLHFSGSCERSSVSKTWVENATLNQRKTKERKELKLANLLIPCYTTRFLYIKDWTRCLPLFTVAEISKRKMQTSHAAAVFIQIETDILKKLKM